MSGDIRNITKEQKYTDKRILDMIKHYLNNVGWLHNEHLSHIFYSIVEGRKAKNKK
tara:strand:- start:87 stop:254 length:168 start_codon:yes stop_codon:yes gene_type:complete